MLKGSSNQEDAVFDVKSAGYARWRSVYGRQQGGHLSDGGLQFYVSQRERMEDGGLGKDGFRMDIGTEVVHLRATRNHVS